MQLIWYSSWLFWSRVQSRSQVHNKVWDKSRTGKGLLKDGEGKGEHGLPSPPEAVHLLQFIFCTSYHNDSLKSDNWNNSTVITKCNGILASMSCLEYMDSWIWIIHILFIQTVSQLFSMTRFQRCRERFEMRHVRYFLHLLMNHSFYQLFEFSNEYWKPGSQSFNLIENTIFCLSNICGWGEKQKAENSTKFHKPFKILSKLLLKNGEAKRRNTLVG